MEYNDKASSKPLLKCGTASATEASARRVPTRLMLLGAFMAMTLLAGCASDNVQGYSSPWTYNPGTGYPAVGGPPGSAW